jgi:hypothetical protein
MDSSTIAPGTRLRKRQRAQEPLGRVAATQRFTFEWPCPVCGGYDRAPREQGLRRFGFRSTKGPYVFCTREEVAGPLPLNRTVKLCRPPPGCGRRLGQWP